MEKLRKVDQLGSRGKAASFQMSRIWILATAKRILFAAAVALAPPLRLLVSLPELRLSPQAAFIGQSNNRNSCQTDLVLQPTADRPGDLAVGVMSKPR